MLLYYIVLYNWQLGLLFIVDVSAWLKSLRLHKYAPLFQQMTYSEMMNLTDDWLEARVSHRCVIHLGPVLLSPIKSNLISDLLIFD